MDKPTRRVRGNSPPPDDLPINYWQADHEPEPLPEDDMVSFLIAVCIIVGFILVIGYAATGY
jgi:hypothetical protein